jgi:hypothetical protein
MLYLLCTSLIGWSTVCVSLLMPFEGYPTLAEEASRTNYTRIEWE